jgi:acyl carrier protein
MPAIINKGNIMTEEEIQMKVLNVVEKETGLKDIKINPDRDIRAQVNLDSMQFVAIIARIEEEFKIDLPIEAMTVTTFRQFVGVLRAQLAG